jgi:hypothetical protein
VGKFCHSIVGQHSGKENTLLITVSCEKIKSQKNKKLNLAFYSFIIKVYSDWTLVLKRDRRICVHLSS